MLARLGELAARRVDFAFETTLASRSFAPWLRDQRDAGYRIHLVFLALMDADLAVGRVAARVWSGGHDIPEPVIRRRYEAGLRNLHGLYRSIVTSWMVIDNEAMDQPVPVAFQVPGGGTAILDAGRWRRLQRTS
jgi:predicted ABC-type ATPase